MAPNDKNHRSHRDSDEKMEPVEIRRGGRAKGAQTNINLAPNTSRYVDTQSPGMSWYEACCVLDQRGFNVTIDLSKLSKHEVDALPEHLFCRPSTPPSSTTYDGGPEEAFRVLLPFRPKIEFKAPKAPQTIGLNLTDAALPPETCDFCGDSFATNTDREAHYAEEATECDQCDGVFKCRGRWSQHACVSGTGSPRKKHRKQNSTSMRSPPPSVLRF